MRFSGFMLILAVMCTLISSGQTPSGTETGIEGIITISPTQAGPVRDDAPSSKPLANATFAVKDEKGEVTSIYH